MNELGESEDIVKGIHNDVLIFVINFHQNKEAGENNGRFQSKGTPQEKKCSKRFKNRLIGFRRVENYFVKKFLEF